MKKGDPTRPTNFSTSVGFSVKPDGGLEGAVWDGVAFKAGITPDMQLQAVNDQRITAAILRAIVAAEQSQRSDQAFAEAW